jgi:hypothetical protein
VLPAKFPEINNARQVINVDDKLLDSIELHESDSPEIVVAILAGKLGYFWWSATGDDFNSYSWQADNLRRFAAQISQQPQIKKLAEAVNLAGLSNVFGSNNAAKIQLNVRWKNARDVTDEFDRAVLRDLGLESEWRNLNIWYRQVMKSSRDNANSVEITFEEITKILKSVP